MSQQNGSGDRARTSLNATDSGPKSKRTLPNGCCGRSKRQGLELMRFVFPDQHGILRGKAIVTASAVGEALAQWRLYDHDAAREGHVSQDRLSGMDERRRSRHGRNGRMNAGDFLLMCCRSRDLQGSCPGRRIPAWVLCDIYFPDRRTGALLDPPYHAQRALQSGGAWLRLCFGLRMRVPCLSHGTIRRWSRCTGPNRQHRRMSACCGTASTI